MNLLDAHVHLQAEELAPFLDQALARAASAGVTAYLCNGVQESDWPQVLNLARNHPQVLPSFGLHPWYVSQRSERWLDTLETHLNSIPSAVGEIGLDRWIEPRDEKAQEYVFRVQLEIAARRNLPATIHCVHAWGWLMDVLRNQAAKPSRFLLHAYGGPVELIRPLADMGAYFSYGGSTLDERKKLRRETLSKMPRDRLLLETDAPDLPPPEKFCVHVVKNPAGKIINEPANLASILNGIAELLGEPPDALAKRVWANGRQFLGRLIPDTV